METALTGHVFERLDPVGDWEGFEGVILLKEVCHRKWALSI